MSKGNKEVKEGRRWNEGKTKSKGKEMRGNSAEQKERKAKIELIEMKENKENLKGRMWKGGKRKSKREKKNEEEGKKERNRGKEWKNMKEVLKEERKMICYILGSYPQIEI